MDTGTLATAATAFTDALGSARIVELSHPLEEGIPTYPTHAKYFQNEWLSHGDIARMNQLVLGEHSGTHVDGPSHFPVEGPFAGTSIAEVPPLALVGPCATIRVDPPLEPNGMLPAERILDWEHENGSLRPGDIVFMDFGWAPGRWALGTRGFAHLGEWPGLSREAAELLRDRGVRAVGTDCISLDSEDGGRGELPAHFVLLSQGILIIENVAQLDRLPPRAFVMGLPLPIVGGTGSPLRLLAAFDDSAVADDGTREAAR